MELLLITIGVLGWHFFESHAVPFCLRVMPKLEDLGALFQELRVESSRCFDVVNRLFLITPHSHIGVDGISYLHIVKRFNEILNEIFAKFNAKHISKFPIIQMNHLFFDAKFNTKKETFILAGQTKS